MLCRATLCHGRQRRWGAPHIKLTCCTATSTVGSTATNQNCWAASTARGAQQVLLTHVHCWAASTARGAQQVLLTHVHCWAASTARGAQQVLLTHVHS